jgi:uncharacterized protein YggE
MADLQTSYSPQPEVQQVVPVAPMVSPKTTGVASFLTLRNILITFACLAGALYLFRLWSPQLTRSITVSGTGQQSFAAASANISVVYFTQDSNKNEVSTKGKEEFGSILTQVKRAGADAVAESAPQIVPLGSTSGSGLFEYRQGAQIHVSSVQNIDAVLNLLQSNNIIIAQTTYLPGSDTTVEETLLQLALENAKQKAESTAKLTNGRLGKVLSVTELSASTPDSGASIVSKNGAASQQTGDSSSVQLEKTINVTYELN